MRATMDHKCQTTDCKYKALVWITKPEENLNKNVCFEHRDELVEEGWELLDWGTR